MRIPNRIKRTTKQYIIVAFICIVVLGGAAIFTSIIITNQIREEYQGLLQKANYEIEQNQRFVYVAIKDILPGETINKDNVVKKTVFSSQPPESFLSEVDKKMALVKIEADAPIQNSMTTDNGILSELREIEYEVVNISSNIANNDTVDVRIFYPNGESYVVLTKKVIKGYAPGTAYCYFWLNEEELLRMSAAIVDASQYINSQIFVTKYIEPNIQEASVVTYVPSISILHLLETDPNILEHASQKLSIEVRKSLENRLAKSMATDVASINWDVNPNIAAVVITPTPTPSPTHFPDQSNNLKNEDTTSAYKSIQHNSEDATQHNSEDSTELSDAEQKELGSKSSEVSYFYYAEEEKAKEDEMEYGE